MSNSEDDLYARHWDHYVTELFPLIQQRGPLDGVSLEEWRVLNTKDVEYPWPGDEWGARSDVEAVLECALFPVLSEVPTVLCEIGSGAGRYTAAVLDRYPEASVLSFDVSRELIAALRSRCSVALAESRLETVRLSADPACMRDAIKARRLEREIDAVYSFDALVHVDLHTLAIYFVTAARSLRVGGILSMNVADAGTERGFLKLLADAPEGYIRRGMAAATFTWVSGDQVEAILSRCGFEVRRLDCNGREAYLVARLVDPQAAESWIQRAGVHW